MRSSFRARPSFRRSTRRSHSQYTTTRAVSPPKSARMATIAIHEMAGRSDSGGQWLSGGHLRGSVAWFGQ